MDSTAKHDGKVLAGLVLTFVAFASIIPDIGFRIIGVNTGAERGSDDESPEGLRSVGDLPEKYRIIGRRWKSCRIYGKMTVIYTV